MGYRLVDLIVSDLSGLSERRVSRRHRREDFSELVEPLPEGPAGYDESLEFLSTHLIPGLTRVNHPRFHAYLPAAGNYVGALGTFLAAGLNSFVGSWLGGGSMALLELVVLEWLADLIDYPKHGSGLLTSGGSMANLIGIAAGCSAKSEVRGRLTFYASRQAHASCQKAALTLGLERQNLRLVDCDEQLRMQPDDLIRCIEADLDAGLIPAVVCANAGTTNTGAIDPLRRVSEICRRFELWFHADGAYGGFAAACPSIRDRFDGLTEADSLALDPHKWLYAPMGVGCVLFPSPGSAEAAFVSSGDYLRDTKRDEEVNFFDRGPELSRPARALSVWLSLRTVGAARMREEILEDLRLANLAQRLIASIPCLEIAFPTSLSVVAFKFRQDPESARAERLMEATLDSGELMISTTELDGRTILRFVVMNHRTGETEVRRSIAAIERLATGIAADLA